MNDHSTQEISMRVLRNLIRDDSGATAIEYGLIAALIAIAAIAAMQGLGSQLRTTFSKTSSVIGANTA